MGIKFDMVVPMKRSRQDVAIRVPQRGCVGEWSSYEASSEEEDSFSSTGARLYSSDYSDRTSDSSDCRQYSNSRLQPPRNPPRMILVDDTTSWSQMPIKYESPREVCARRLSAVALISSPNVSPEARPVSVADGSMARASSPASLLYAQIQKRSKKPSAPPLPPKRVRFGNHQQNFHAPSLSSIKELSPINSSGAGCSPRFVADDDGGLWPPAASTCPAGAGTTPVHTMFRSPARPLPKTNPYFGTPQGMTTPQGGAGHQQRCRQALGNRLLSLDALERRSSYYDLSESDDMSSLNGGGMGAHVINRISRKRPNPFGIHETAVRKYGIRGELYLTVTVHGPLMTIYLDRGRNFQGGAVSPCNTYVRLELLNEKEGRTKCRTALVPRTDTPVFNQIFTIELLPEDYHDYLSISVYNRDITLQSRGQLLGCMAFTVKHLVQPNKETDGWYFLLQPKYGLRKHLAVSKVNMLTYYGSVDSGLQGSDDHSSNQDGSNGEYWNRPAAVANNHHHQHRQEDDATNDFDQTSRANLLNGDATSDTSASTNDQNGHRARHLGRQRALTTNSSASSTTTGSSSWLAPLKSGAASQPATPRGARRFFGALVSRSPLRKLSAVSAPRKVTVEVERPRRVLSASRLNDMDGAPRGTKPVPVTFYEGDDELAGASTSAPKCYLSVHQSRISEEASGPSVDGCMRRASSFSGRENVNGQPHPLERKGSADDMPGNGSVEHLPKHDADFKKMFSFTGPLAKKLSFLNKKKPEVVGGTGSAGGHSDAAVRPTKVDLLNWATCFDNLLKHKYGCQLFRTFLQREFSEENIDFWIACEEYKRIKDPKKLALRAKEIYIEFVAVQSPKEVNLDSDTRSATQASLAGADRNTFDSAQYRIEHLMEKDSYPRFLKSELYTELLNSIRK